MNIQYPQSSEQFEQYFYFRWLQLRAAWNQPRGSEQDNLEKNSYHAMIINNKNEICAIGRLHAINKYTAQIRYMAVSPVYQGQGMGKQILLYLEDKARKLDIKEVILHARENATGFYEHHGYKNTSPSHILFDEIRHYLMVKTLDKKTSDA